jgi:serine/threonine-protein kinase RsbW
MFSVHVCGESEKRVAAQGSNGGGRAVRLTIPARAEYVGLSRLALTGLARLGSFSDEALADLQLAVTEACTNSVRHAYADRVGAVEIRYELFADRVVVEVSDDGPGFVPVDEVAVDGVAELNEGGLGIAIIRAISDELEIGTRDGGGVRLRFVKLLAP